jgi:BNR/Asp-box repeat
MVSAQAMAGRAAARQALTASPSVSFGPNVQMNDDSSPPLPQNETAVAVSLANPKIAVAAANDYVSGGNVVMRTLDGGRHWSSTRVVPVFDGTGDICTGGDPSVAYSRRDHAFYMGQLCFFRSLPFSEVQVYVSHDNGHTWTPGRAAARAATNFNYTNGTVDTSILNDKDYIAVDNTPTSPHYGRLYVGYTKFHILPSGFSDYCPLQLSYTDTVNQKNPSLTTFQHTAIQPDNPGGDGTGVSANQYFTPQVERSGALDVAFMSEDCNDSFDPHVLFQRSTNGGASFLPNAVQVDKPGQYMDFLDAAKDDTLPPTNFRAPNTPSLAYNPVTGSLTFVYQNNINRPVSKADISYQRSTDGGKHWSNMRFLSVNSSGKPARNDQFFPWIAAAGNGNLYAIWFDRRLDAANININTWEARSANDGATWTSRRISTKSWNPNLGFFTSGAFIGDYNGIAVSSTNVYPVWTDGRNTAIARTGIGETDIFTDVEPR